MTSVDPSSYRPRWWATEDKVIVPLDALREFCIQCLRNVGMPLEKAAFTADARLEKDMQGDHLRGVADIPVYCQQMEQGVLDPDPPLRVLAEAGATALLDGGNGFHFCVGFDAMRLCVEKAKRHGIAMVGVRAQLGTLSPYFKLALAEHLVAFGTIHGPPVIAPTGGTQAIIGNNPTGFAFPTRNKLPVTLDASFSQSSATPMFHAAREGRQVAPGLLLDRYGNPTTDPRDFANPPRQPGKGPSRSGQYGAFQGGGSLVPIGGYKGYAFAITFGLLTTVLTGPRTPLGNPPRGWHYDRPGSLFICIDPGVFGPVEEFEAALDEYLQMVNDSPRRQGVEAIFYPGQVSGEAIQRHRAANTLPLTPQGVEKLREHARSKGMQLGI